MMTRLRIIGPVVALLAVLLTAAGCPVTPVPVTPHSHPLNPAPEDISEQGQLIVDLVNEQRVAAGCDELVVNGSFVAFANNQAKWMDNGGGFVHSRLGAPIFAENLSQGIVEPEQLIKTWMDSTEHKANITNCEYTDTGVGISGEFVVEVFGNADPD
jgi:uncharacterized protein YkwD